MEKRIEQLKQENYKLQRQNSKLQKQLNNKAVPYPAWSLYDWEQAYGETEYKT